MRTNLVFTTCFVLAACSGGAPSNPTTGDAVEGAVDAVEGRPEGASAEAGAEAETAKVNCSSLPSPDSKPDNDLIGIDLGMSADDALRIGQCSKEGYEVTVEEDKSVTLPDGSHGRGMIELRKPNDRVNIFVMGLPGQETVYGLVREKKFKAGEEPTLERMRADLVEKYGAMVPTSSVANSPYELAQSFASDGKPIPGNDIGGGWNCASVFGQNNNLGQLNERCGFTKKISVKAGR